jgi:hypothetical protein
MLGHGTLPSGSGHFRTKLGVERLIKGAGGIKMNRIGRIAYSSVILSGMLIFSKSVSFAEGSDALGRDIRCAVVGIKAGESSNSAVRIAGLITALFYLGRVDAQAPAGSGDTMITSEIATITAPTLHSDAMRCGNELSQKGPWLERIGKALSEAR